MTPPWQRRSQRPALPVTGLTPATGAAVGGTGVTITGSGFTGVSSVRFGTTSVAFNFVSDTQITTTTPAGSGTVHVTVSAPTGTSAPSAADQFTYAVPVPVVTGVSPRGGVLSGGTAVTITGSGFTGVTLVRFGARAATVNAVTATQLSVTTPSGAGTVNVSVTTPGGTSAVSSADLFTYTKPPKEFGGKESGGKESLLAAEQLPERLPPAPEAELPSGSRQAFIDPAERSDASTPPGDAASADPGA